MQTCPRPLRVSILKPSVSVDFLWMSAEHMWMSPDLWWLSAGLWPPVTVSSHRKIKSSHHSYFPLLTRVFKAALPFPTTVPFRVQVSSWGAALDENSSFQAWFHSGSFWELGKSSKTSKLKTSPHDLPTFSLVRLAGGQSSGTECLLLASFLITPPTTVTNYTINPIFPNFQAMLTWP